MGAALRLAIVGGLDPTAGAGILRDVCTARHFRPSLPVRTIVSAWTRQGHGGPAEIQAVDPEELAWQLDAVQDVGAVKVGVLPGPAVEVVCAWLDRLPEAPALVVDPVLWATDGGALGHPETLKPLIERATLVTPNATEARVLVGSSEGAEALIRRWARQWAVPILLKGGHLEMESARVCDRLWDGASTTSFERRREAQPDVRGTGCALATAIAAELVSDTPRLVDAVGRAIAWLDRQRGVAVCVAGDGCFLP